MFSSFIRVLAHGNGTMWAVNKIYKKVQNKKL
jgi:hypothetical protein